MGLRGLGLRIACGLGDGGLGVFSLRFGFHRVMGLGFAYVPGPRVFWL